jgi:D-amino-acid dehydrogenase
MRFQWSALPRMSRFLGLYWWHSRDASYRRIVEDYSKFIAHSLSEHMPLIEEAGASGLIGKAGWLKAYRTPAGFDAARAEAESLEPMGIEHRQLDPAAMQTEHPALRASYVGGIQWTQPWSVRDPLALTQAYLRLFQKLGGRFVTGDAMTLRPVAGGWEVDAEDGAITAREVVVALGPWADRLLRRLGRRLPLGGKRGYHMHYRPVGGVTLSLPTYDEAGFLVAPMNRGLRLTTGAEFASLEAPPNPAQLDSAEAVARAAFPLGERLDEKPWMGVRPCTPDMKPIIGPEGREGLWLAIGHAHHGLTLGPATGRLLAEMMTGEKPFIDPSSYAATRFG